MPNSQAPLTRMLRANEPCLLLCAGKDCVRKEQSAFKKLEVAASNAGLELSSVKCQGSCKGPTAVVPTESGPRWFESLDSSKARADLIQFALNRSEPSRRLAKRELKGKRREKAAKKLSSQIR